MSSSSGAPSSAASSTSPVIHVRHLDLADVTYGAARTLDSGAKSIPVFYKGRPLVLQTEDMRIPFGIRDAFGAGAADAGGAERSTVEGSGKKSVDFSVDKDTAQTFYDKMTSMDELIIGDALKHSKQWFRKVHDKRDVLEALYTPMVKFSRDRDTGEINNRYSPLFKANLPVKLGVVQTDVYDTERNKIDIATNDLRGARAVAIIQCSGVWVAGGKFGCSWRVLQMRVSDKRQPIQGYAFIDDEEDSNADVQDDSNADVKADVNVVVNDSTNDSSNAMKFM